MPLVLEKYLKNLVAKLNLYNSTTFPGKMLASELAEYFAASDVFVGPSVVDDSGDTEGLGIVFLEALASNTAVVASRVGGITDFIVDQETGLLVKQKDPEDIAVSSWICFRILFKLILKAITETFIIYPPLKGRP